MDHRTLKSDYMDFAKFKTGALYNLASSGVMDCVFDELGAGPEDLALHGPNAGGFAPLTSLVAERFRVSPDEVVMPGGGCSFANHLALAALVAPGDEVLLEMPTYELLETTLGYLGARLIRFERRPETGFAVDPEGVRAAITPRTRLVAMTNLHNPSGAAVPDAVVHDIADRAMAQGALVLVDEVYRELTFAPDQAQTAFRAEGGVVVTSSLTKAYGLSGLRCGWILAPATSAARMRRLNDLFGVHPPHVSETLALAAFRRLGALKARADALVGENRAAFQAVLGGHPRLEARLFDHATTVFARPIGLDAEQLTERLLQAFDTGVGPGRFFGDRERIRLGLGGSSAPTREGLQRLARALEGANGP
jgi:aspartate/methionine/tyrosine aminotransferase